MKLNGLYCALSLLVTASAFSVFAQTTAAQITNPIPAQLLQFDNEHDLAHKESLLAVVTSQYPSSAPALLRLAETTTNTDTRWMAMRGMVTLHYAECAPFLERALQDSDAFVRANAARAAGDLRISAMAIPILAMFSAERERPAIEQGSLALLMLGVKAAAPSIREKIPQYTGQTRGWLFQALGSLGNISDVPLIAAYLDEMVPDGSAAVAIAELAGVDFGAPKPGLGGYPMPQVVAAQKWWTSHQLEWPQCADCHPK